MRRYPATGACVTAGLCVIMALFSEDARADQLPIKPSLSTIAGTGAFGMADGPALSATFIEPYGLAYGPDGSLVIADRAAQRVRELTTHGTVITVAGNGDQVSPEMGVEGGFADGPALSAKFNGPTGVAVDGSGVIYVADAKNHALREIRAGMVSTIAGSPLSAGHVDGPAAQATFVDPRAVAVDGKTLYVADYPNGIRVITPARVVSTVVPPEPVVSLAVEHFRPNVFHTSDNVLLAGSVSAIYVYELPSMKRITAINLGWSYVSPAAGEGGVLGGPAGSLTGLGDDGIAYADPLFRTVHWMNFPTVAPFIRTLTGEPLIEAPSEGGRFADGPGDVSSLVEPTAVARAPDGSLVVADAGARRLRKFGAFDERNQEAVLSSGEFPEARSPKDVRIAIVGDSYVNMGVAWQQAIPGVVETELSKAVGAANKVQVLPVRREGVGALAALDLIDTYFSDGNVNVVILDFPAQDPTDYIAEQNTTALPEILKRLKATDSTLRNKKTSFYVLLHPAAWDFPGEMEYRTLPRSSDGESQWENDEVVRDPQVVHDVYDKISSTLRDSGVHVIDLWPTFLHYHAGKDALPLFGSWDHHFTVTGNALVGHEIAERLTADQAWK